MSCQHAQSMAGILLPEKENNTNKKRFPLQFSLAGTKITENKSENFMDWVVPAEFGQKCNPEFLAGYKERPD